MRLGQPASLAFSVGASPEVKGRTRCFLPPQDDWTAAAVPLRATHYFKTSPAASPDGACDALTLRVAEYVCGGAVFHVETEFVCVWAAGHGGHEGSDDADAGAAPPLRAPAPAPAYVASETECDDAGAGAGPTPSTAT